MDKIGQVKTYILDRMNQVGFFMGSAAGWNNARVRITKLLLEMGDLTEPILLVHIDEMIKKRGQNMLKEIEFGWSPSTTSDTASLAYAISKGYLSDEEIAYVKSNLLHTETLDSFLKENKPELLLGRFLDYLITEKESVVVSGAEMPANNGHDSHSTCNCRH